MAHLPLQLSSDLKPMSKHCTTSAAGVPWFLTLFGRDSLIPALMAGLDGVWSAKAALSALSSLQATKRDDWRDAEFETACLLIDLLLLPARTRHARMNCFHTRRARSMSVSAGTSLALPASSCRGVGPQDRPRPHTAEAWHRRHLQSAAPGVLAW